LSEARAVLFVAAMALAGPATAQSSGNGFLFGEPHGSVALRGGFAMPSAGSDIFSFSTSQLTLNRSDFTSPDASAEVAFRVMSRLDVVANVAFSGMTKPSESRNFVGSDGLPIEQTTTFRRVPITLSARYYLTDRGRNIGRFAWVPARVAPYVGAGVGMMNYSFDQSGDFVDNTTKNVFGDQFNSSGWTPMGQALAGVDWSLGPRWALSTEAKYVSASADLSTDFVGFHRIDLSGFSTSVGFFVRF
jgi:outer membrane protein W